MTVHVLVLWFEYDWIICTCYREKSKQLLTKETSTPSLPYKLEVINEDSTEPTTNKAPPRRTRARSPGALSRSLSNSRVPAGDALHLPRSRFIAAGYVENCFPGSSMLTPGSLKKKGRGQRSVTRPLIGNYDTSDVAILVRNRNWLHVICTVSVDDQY